MNPKNISGAFYISLVAVVFAIISCKKTEVPANTQEPGPINQPPGQFTISLETSSWETAKISWTKAMDPDNDSVLYTVYLNDTLKIENSTHLGYEFSGLKELTLYNVKVVAVDSKNKQTFSNISFTTKKFWLRYLHKIEYGNISGYSAQGSGRMIKGNDGGYVIIGKTELLNSTITKFVVMKIDSLGNENWKKYYDYDTRNTDFLRINSTANGYILSGADQIIKIDNNGNLQWQRNAADSSFIKGNAIDNSGNIYTVGNVYNEALHKVEASFCKYSQNGDPLWTKSISYSVRDQLVDIKILNDNELIILGDTGEDADADFLVVKSDAQGNIYWHRIYPDLVNSYAFPENIIKTSEGNYVFTGFSSGKYDTYLYLQMIDADGNNMWTYIGNDEHTRAYSVSETKDNNLIVSGGFILDASAQSALYKFDKSGNKLWRKLYEEFATYLFNKTVIPTSDGGYITNAQKAKPYNSGNETDQIYIFKTDDKGEFN